MENKYNLTEETKICFNINGGGKQEVLLKDLLASSEIEDREQAMAAVEAFLDTGRATIVEEKTPLEKTIDDIAKELKAVNQSKMIQEDREERFNYKDNQSPIQELVRYKCKSILHAQEIMQMMMKNYSLKPEQIELSSTAEGIYVYVHNIPYKTYEKIDRALGFRDGAEALTNTVERGARGVVNTSELVLNNVGVPVAKTAITTTTKVAKSVVGLGAKLIGIAIGEVTKSSKECINEIRTDGYINEAKGELLDAKHSIAKALNNRTRTIGGRGEIIG